MGYTIVTEIDIVDLIAMVNSRIKVGWKPIGGVTVRKIENLYIYHQAMIKE